MKFKAFIKKYWQIFAGAFLAIAAAILFKGKGPMPGKKELKQKDVEIKNAGKKIKEAEGNKEKTKAEIDVLNKKIDDVKVKLNIKVDTSKLSTKEKVDFLKGLNKNGKK